MEELKIKVGSYYLTRNGRLAYVAGKTPEKLDCNNAMRDGHTFCGAVSGNENFYCWNESGKAYHTDADLVAEWVEPKRIKGWVAIKGNAQGLLWPDPQLHSTRSLAEKCSPSVIACIEIDVLEGQGLDGSANNG